MERRGNASFVELAGRENWQPGGNRDARDESSSGTHYVRIREDYRSATYAEFSGSLISPSPQLC